MHHLSHETRRAYDRAWRCWSAWCDRHGLLPRPADDASLTAHLRARLDAGASPATVRKDLAGILALHQQAADVPAARALVRDLDCRPRRQAVALDWRAVDLVAELTRRAGDGLAVRDAAIIRVGSDGLLRVSDLAALLADDLDDRGQAMTLSLSSPKTGAARTVYLGPPTARLVREWLLQSGRRSGSLWKLKADTIARVIRRRAAAAGIEGASGHSLRVGAAQSLAEAGASLVEMQLAGGWRSPAMPAHYARSLLAERGAVARLRYSAAGVGALNQ